MEDLKRKLTKDIDVSTMLTMRGQGMTNKQIADALGVHPNTVYRYIGRMSQAVKYAEIQNKPSPIGEKITAQPDLDMIPPVPEKPTPTYVAIDTPPAATEEKPAEHHVAKRPVFAAPIITNGDSLLRVISTRSTLQGSLCNYVVDSETGSIEMTDGIITGLLDRDTVQRFIAELQEACKLIG